MNEKQVDKGQQYVQDARAHGKSDHDIRRSLERAGWRESRIEELLATPAPHSAGSTETSPASRFELPSYGENIGAGQTLSEAFSALVHAPMPFLLTGLVVGLLMAMLVPLVARFAPRLPGVIDLEMIIIFALIAPGLACLCQMAIQTLRGHPVRVPTWSDIRRIGPAALFVGAVSAVVLSIAAIGPMIVIKNWLGFEGGGFFDGTWVWQGLICFVLGLPLALGLIYLVALPALSLALPAVADGAGAGRALLLSYGRGLSNVGALVLLEIVATVVFALLVVVVQQSSAVVEGLGGGGPPTYTEPFWAELVMSLVVALEIAVFLPWLAAVVSSAYLQATGGGSEQQTRLRSRQIQRSRSTRSNASSAKNGPHSAP